MSRFDEAVLRDMIEWLVGNNLREERGSPIGQFVNAIRWSMEICCEAVERDEVAMVMLEWLALVAGRFPKVLMNWWHRLLPTRPPPCRPRSLLDYADSDQFSEPVWRLLFNLVKNCQAAVALASSSTARASLASAMRPYVPKSRRVSDQLSVLVSFVTAHVDAGTEVLRTLEECVRTIPLQASLADRVLEAFLRVGNVHQASIVLRSAPVSSSVAEEAVNSPEAMTTLLPSLAHHHMALAADVLDRTDWSRASVDWAGHGRALVRVVEAHDRARRPAVRCGSLSQLMAGEPDDRAAAGDVVAAVAADLDSPKDVAFARIVAIGGARDEHAGVRAAACRALSSLLAASLDPLFASDAALAVRDALADPSPSVRARAAAAAATLCLACQEHAGLAEDTSADLLADLVERAFAAGDRARTHAARAAGAWLAAAPADSPRVPAVAHATASALSSGPAKGRWNAACAIEVAAPSHPSLHCKWRRALLRALRDGNVKCRVHSLRALRAVGVSSDDVPAIERAAIISNDAPYLEELQYEVSLTIKTTLPS